MFYVCVTVSPPLKHVDMVVDFDELKMILAGMFLHAGHNIYAGQYNLGKKMSFSSSIELKMFCFYLKHLRFFFCIIFPAFTDVCNTSRFSTICESISLLFTASSRSLREMLW